MSNKGFTLMELLSVIIIIGIITAISIPLIANIQNNDSKNNFNYYMGMVKEATSLYEDTYLPSFDDTTTCIVINYNKLLETDLLKEENFKCSGKIVGTRTKNKGYNYEYYLNCKDSKNHVLSNNSINLFDEACKFIN